MAGLVPAIHILFFKPRLKEVDARDKPGMTKFCGYKFLMIPASIKSRLKRRASAPSLQA
jgi:hypothetical protein